VSAVAGLVLAAGAGKRFGGPKAVAALGAERLVDRAVRTLLDGGVAPAYVVSGAVSLDVPGAVVVDNPDWRSGIGSSLRAGLAALPSDVVAAVVVLVDQPGLTAEAVRRVAASVEGPGGLASATYDGVLGHPVALGRDHWAGAAGMALGDTGARPYLLARPEVVVRVECGDVASAEDVDVPADLERFGRATR
jgi:CTP:molybdopterin cytidylyltransferase MocA